MIYEIINNAANNNGCIIFKKKAGQSVGVSGKTFKKWCDQYENKR